MSSIRRWKSTSWISALPSQLTFLLLVLVGAPLTRGVNPLKVADGDLEPAGSVPEVSVAEPNLGTLLGIGNPLAAGNPAALLQGIGGHHALGGGIPGMTPSLQNLRDTGALGRICNNNNGNSDALTNLLVYQYLSGSLPGGAANGPPPPVVPPTVVNPHLQALLEGSRESKTATSVTTTLTTRTITMEASTKFSTSTTSYVTTVTSLTSSILPIIFRGSKITTTITDRKTEILTATEFHTSSSVLTPSIIQTLNVEVTLTQTSTKGLNGHFTLAHVTPGASKVLEQPVSTSSSNFDLDLSNLDLASIGNGDNAQVVNALTALLKQYNDEPENKHGPQSKRGQERERPQQRFPQSRFHTRSRFSPPESKSNAKFNVIRGFTLSDAPETNDNGNAGSALENTRYSKFRKKSKVENNSLRGSERDRENERFSASTSRQTVSANTRRGQRSSRGRSRTSSARSNRQTERSRRTSNIRSNQRNAIRIAPRKNDINFKTTLLTMYISGLKPGDVITTVRTVTLRALGTERIKRQIETVSPTSISEPITNTEQPEIGSILRPERVVDLLKGLDKSVVRKMLYSLNGWVEYYLHQVLDEMIVPSFSFESNDIYTNEIPELYPSQIEEESSSSQIATVALLSLPNAITAKLDTTSSSIESCPKVSVVTETVYQTFYKSNP